MSASFLSPFIIIIPSSCQLKHILLSEHVATSKEIKRPPPWPALRPPYVIQHGYCLHNAALSVRYIKSSISGFFLFGFELFLGACKAFEFVNFSLRNATQTTILSEWGFPRRYKVGSKGDLSIQQRTGRTCAITSK